MAVEFGEYTRLVIAVQADADPDRRQVVHTFLARIGPMAGSMGADGRCRGDALAAPMLAAMYPPATAAAPEPAGPAPAAESRPCARLAAATTTFEAAARAALASLRADAFRAAAAAPAERPISDTQ